MDSNEMVLWILAGIGVGVLVYCGMQMTNDKPIPQDQKEGQMLGLGTQAGMKVEAGAPLDMRISTHFWSPEYDDAPQPTVQSRHRYPAVPGGNLSTVMHKGWSSLSNDSPNGNDWLITPPEAAVL